MPRPLYRYKSSNMFGLLAKPVYFKEVFSTRTIILNINPNLPIDQFIIIVREPLSIHFNISINEIELVLCGQDIIGLQAEDAPSLSPSPVKLRSVWGENLTNLAFYVRRKNYQYPQFRYNRINTNNDELVSYPNPLLFNNTIDGLCPICLDSTSLRTPFNCDHGVCSDCFRRCQTFSISNCSICRTF